MARGTIDWTEIDVPEAEHRNEEYDEMSARFLETLMRVTFAGFGGALVGLSHQKRVASSGGRIFQRAITTTKKKEPPVSPPMRKQQQQRDETNYPLMWATSFMAFVSILETSRLLSPTTSIVNILSHSEIPSNDNSRDDTIVGSSQKEELIQPRLERPYYATLTDYTLGGTVAGLAGSMSSRGPPASSSTSKLQLPSAILQGGRRSLILSGIGTGFALGFVAGLCQTALDTADTFLKEEQEREEEMEKQKQEQEQDEDIEPVSSQDNNGQESEEQ